MKEILQHPVYGEIVYDESFWTGKKTITVNGVRAVRVSKKEYLIDGKESTLVGNFFTGITLYLDGETIRISPKTKWYELLLAILPFFFLITWGNSQTLCAIFPVVGGAIGGGLGAFCAVVSLSFMKKQSSPIFKVLIGIIAAIATIFIAFILAIALAMLLL